MTVTGPSLGWCLKRPRGRRLSTADACAVGVEVLRHLRLMHAAGFAHRDVSPANLLLPHQPAPPGAPLLCVIDFGLAAPLPAREPKQA